MTDLTAVVRRAAARMPGPSAERSLAACAAWLPRTVSVDVPITDPAPTLGLLRIGAGEAWCLCCGETVSPEGFCQRCGARRSRPVAAVLRPHEYYIAA